MIYVYLFSILIARVVQAIFSKRSSNEVDNIVLTVKYTAYKCAVSAGFGLILLLTDITLTAKYDITVCIFDFIPLDLI